MSRSSYSDDYGDEFPGQLGLYRGNVERSIRSKKGQARLRELRDALEAMPVKSLEAHAFIRPSGEACALGQWALRHIKDKVDLDEFDGAGDEETADLLDEHGWPKLVVFDLIFINDDDRWVRERPCEGPHRRWTDYRGHFDLDTKEWSETWPVIYHRRETPEERHARVLRWVNEHLMSEAQP